VRASFPELLRQASARGSAVGAFTCYDLETATGVLRAAAERRRGVVLLVSRASFVGPEGALLVAALRSAADRAAVPAALQLDHVAERVLVERAFALGVDAVMADGSALPFEDNVAFVREAVELARAAGGHVEAELGGIAGDEDVAAAVAAGALTDPHEARAFVERTGAACLAVSIGNVHGAYREPPRLDWARLESIRARVGCPLSLHGASGIPDADLRRAIALGVVKVNVNTELREAYLAATAARLEDALEGARVLELHAAQADAAARVAGAKLDAYERA
jgi:tagatose 1,6-diphosphate aldolase GatY/KbaY